MVRGDAEDVPRWKKRKTREESTEPSAPARPEATGAPAASPQPFRCKLREFFLANKLSAKDTFELASTCRQEVISSAADLANVGAHGRAPQNYARDLMRRFLAGCKMPDVFSWPLPVWNPDAKKEEPVEHPFLLPHELLHSIVQKEVLNVFQLTDPGHSQIRKLLQKECQHLSIPESNTLAIGLHGDGVPYTKKDSIEIISWNFLSHPSGDRIPITAISKKYVGPNTWHAVMKVIAWSFRVLSLGVVFSRDPDGDEWDCRRHLAAGSTLACRALLLQVRGDWPFLRALFSFPAWNSPRICWKCAAALEGPCAYTSTSLAAPWRQERLSDFDFLQSLRDQQIQVSPLLQLPGFRLSYVVLDWLHIVDLGVGADMMGCFFWTLIRNNNYLDGPNKDVRTAALWRLLKDWYSETKPASRLDNLTEEMIKRSGTNKKPKLRAKGAECRYIIKFAVDLSKSLHQADPSSAEMSAIAELFNELWTLQLWVSGSKGKYNSEIAAAHCRRFCLMYEALRASGKGDNLWQFKPKLHLLQELVEYQSHDYGSPRLYWTYRDESWCGFMAKANKRRGGCSVSSTIAFRFLQRYRAMQD